MFEQITKAMQAAFQNSTANPFFAATQEATQKAQQNLAKLAADASEYAQMEVAHAMSIAQARKPEEAVAAVVKAAQARQAYFTQKGKDAYDALVASSTEWSKTIESKTTEMASQSSSAIDAAFTTAKQGLGMAETAVKSAVAKTSKGKSKA